MRIETGPGFGPSHPKVVRHRPIWRDTAQSLIGATLTFAETARQSPKFDRTGQRFADLVRTLVEARQTLAEHTPDLVDPTLSLVALATVGQEHAILVEHTQT